MTTPEPDDLATDDQPATDPPADPPAATEVDRDAIRYRKQLRESESQREQLAARLESLQRNEIARLAVDQRLAVPAAIWANGASLADFLDDVGDVDPAKVAEIAETAISALGLGLTDGPPRMEGGPRTSAPRQKSWSDLLNPNR